MHALSFFQGVPDTGLAWIFFGLLAILIIVIIVGSFTQRGQEVSPPEVVQETGKTPRKPGRSNSMKQTKKR
jgi:cytoskeletal protein RodZ